MEAARAPALRSAVLGAARLPYPKRGIAGHTEARAFRMAPGHHAGGHGSGDGCIRSGISRCCQTPLPARFGYNPSTMPCRVAWYGRDFREPLREGGRDRKPATIARQHAAKMKTRTHTTALLHDSGLVQKNPRHSATCTSMALTDAARHGDVVFRRSTEHDHGT